MRNHKFKNQEDVIHRVKFGHMGLNSTFFIMKKNMRPANVNVVILMK